MSGTSTSAISLDVLGSYSSPADAPSYLLLVDGVQVGSGTVASYNFVTQSFMASLSTGVPHTISVEYLNDNTSGDLLRLNSITVNGTTISSSDSSETYVSSHGTQVGQGEMFYGGQINFAVPASDVPAASGVPPTSAPTPTPTPNPGTPAPVTVGSGPDTLALSISEDAYSGDAQFTITIDGVQQGGTQTATASHGLGQSQTFDIEGSFGTSQHTVVVNFLNDLFGGSATTDRNLYVTAATINGTSIAGAALTEASGGPQSFVFNGNAAAPAPVTTPTPPVAPATVTIGAGSDTLALDVSEDAYSGNAQFTISIDGVQQGTSQTASAAHSSGQTQTFDVLGSFAPGAHTVTVNFLNDDYGGSATTDRNLYVTGATIDGNAVAGSALNETSGGPQSFTFVEPGTVPTTPILTATGPAYYVAAGGSDSGNGSAAQPFSSIQYALSQMEAHGVKVLYLGNGTYSVPSTITLTAADSGDTILAAPGASPVLDGGHGTSTILSLSGANNVTLSGLSFVNTTVSDQGAALVLNGSTGDTISGNTFNNNGESVLFAAGSSNNNFTRNTVTNSATSAVEVKDASNYNSFSNNTINGVGVQNVAGGAFFGHGISYDSFTNNLIENTAGSGIALEDFGHGTNTANIGNVISNNELLNTSTAAASTDDGAIYLLGRSDIDTATTVSMNFISNVGNTNLAGHVEGIYLDDNESGVTVTSNIVQGVQSDAVELHGGYNDTFTNNIFNLGNTTRTVALIQQPEPDYPATVQPALTGDQFSHNIVLSNQSNPYYAYVYFDPESVNVPVSSNLYYDPASAGGGVPMAAPITDQSPIIGNPNFAAAASGNYAIGAGSASSLIGFIPINQSLIGPQ